MIKNNGAEFLIEIKNMHKIISNMQMKNLHCKPIMIDGLLRRRLYQVKKDENDDQIKWLRVLEGDVGCDGSHRCTITYKDRKPDMSREDYALLNVDNFDDANHLFDLLKFTCTSYQENRRSKFICKLDKVKYVIKFDIWPKIEDVVFVSINALTSADKESLKDFVEALEIMNYNISQSSTVDVDAVYFERFSRTASLIPNLTFDFDI